MKIYHIADIHIKQSNNENIKSSFNQLIKLNPELLVIAGDLYHDKGKISPNDIEFANRIVKLLTKNKIRTIIIPGNHDTNMNDLDNRKSNISKTIKNTEFVQCYDESTIITINDVEFYLFSILDRKLLTPNDNKLTKVMVLHEAIPGRLSVKDLNFDLVLLGDNHTTKFLKSNIAYPGAFVQNTKAESIDRGYIVWDTSTLTGKFIPIPLLSIQLVIKAVNNKCNLPVINSTISKLILEYNNCDNDYIKKLKQNIISNYGPIHEVINNTIEQVINTKQEQIKFDNDKLFDERIKDPIKLAQIKKFHGELNIKPPTHSNFKLISMAWSNVLTYKGFNCIDFMKCKNKTILINGTNASGKSSIIDILIFGLFDQVYRGGKNDMLNQESVSGFIKIIFSIDSDIYNIEIILNKGRREPFIFKNGVSETKDSKVATYNHISSVIGIGTADDFINSNVSLQGRQSLIDSSTKDKKGLTLLLSKITGMETFKLLKTAAEEISTKHNIELKRLRNLLKGVNKIDESVLKSEEQLIDYKNTEKDSLLKSIERLTGKLSSLSKKYDSKINNTYEVTEFEANFIPSITKEEAFDYINQSIDISKFKDVDFDDIKLRSTINYEEQINTLQSKINELNIEFDNKIKPSNIEPKNGKIVSDEIINKFDSITIKLPTLEQYELQLAKLTNLKLKNTERLKSLYLILKPQPVGEINTIKLPAFIDRKKHELLSQMTKQPKPIYYDDYDQYKKYLSENIIADKLEFNPKCPCCKINKNKLSSDIIKYNEIKEKVILIEKFNEYKDFDILNEIVIQDTLRTNKKINDEIELILSDNIDSQIDEIKRILPIYKYKDDVEFTKQSKAYNQFKITSELLINNKLLTILKASHKKQQSDLLLLQHEFHVKNYQSIEYYKSELIKLNKKIAIKIDEIKTDLKSKSIEYETLNKDLIKLTKSLTILQTNSDKFNNDTTLYNEHKANYDIAEDYKKHVDFDEGIPKAVFNNLCKNITDITNKTLYSMNANFTVSIVFDKNIDIFLINGSNTITAERASGYQKSIIEFILRSVIISISDVSNCGLLFIDEGFSTLDSENLSAFTSILKTFRSGFDTLFIITHLSELKTFADDKIDVIRGEQLIYGNLTEESFNLKSITTRKKDIMNVKEFKNSNTDIMKRKAILMPSDDGVSLSVLCLCGVSHKRINIMKFAADKSHNKYI